MQMPIDPPKGSKTNGIDDRLAKLEGACTVWVERRDERPLRRWLARELDHDGSPKTLALEDWGPCLDRLVGAQRERGDWSLASKEKVEGLFRWLVHASRPDGSVVFGPKGKTKAQASRLIAGVTALANPALAAVVGRWFPSVVRPSVAPPLPAICDDDRVLAMLRPDWTSDGDWLAVDHRARGDSARIEVSGGGPPWVLGEMQSTGGAKPGPVSPAVPSCWNTDSLADCLEWTFRSGTTKVTRTAVLLRYRQVALLAQQEDGAAITAGLRVSVADGVGAIPAVDFRALTLTRSRSTARIIPLALPALTYPTERGSLVVEGSEAVLRQQPVGRRRWLPLLVTWGKPPNSWRTLTVTERSKICGPDVAFAARVSWGVEVDGLLIYRSLARPALRAVLGLQTRARFLIGRFTPDGEVVPLLTLE